MRTTGIENKPQLTLGELIKKLEGLSKNHSHSGESKHIRFDFGYFAPNELHSWRGSYNELAISFDSGPNINACDFLNDLKKGIGQTYTGWKGGDFTMDEDSPVWVSNEGCAMSTVIINIIDDDYDIILLTTHCNS